MLLTSTPRSSPLTRLTTRGLGKRGGAQLGEHQEIATTPAGTNDGEECSWQKEQQVQRLAQELKKADVAEAEGKGDSGRRQGQKGRHGLEDLVTTTHAGTSRSAWPTASTQAIACGCYRNFLLFLGPVWGECLGGRGTGQTSIMTVWDGSSNQFAWSCGEG